MSLDFVKKFLSPVYFTKQMQRRTSLNLILRSHKTDVNLTLKKDVSRRPLKKMSKSLLNKKRGDQEKLDLREELEVIVKISVQMLKNN